MNIVHGSDYIAALEHEVEIARAIYQRWPHAVRTRLWKDGPVVWAVFDAFSAANRLEVVVAGDFVEVHAYVEVIVGKSTARVYAGVGPHHVMGTGMLQRAFIEIVLERLRKDEPSAYDALVRVVAAVQGRAPAKPGLGSP